MFLVDRRHELALFLGVAVALVSVQLVASLQLDSSNGIALATGMTFDLVVVLPLAGWWLLVRGRGWPLLSLAPLFVAGATLADVLIPDAFDQPVRVAVAVAVLIEAGVVVDLAVKARGVRRSFTAQPGPLFFDRLRFAVSDRIGEGRVVDALASEVGLMVLAVTGWRQRPPEGDNVFTSHQRSGVVGVLSALAVVLVVELVAVHLLLSVWFSSVAWVVSVLTMYGIVWLVGDIHGIRTHPHLLSSQDLQIRAGLRWSTDIPRASIESAMVVGRGRRLPSSVLSLVTMGEPDVVLHLSAPVEVRGLFGARRTSDTIGISVDDPRRLISELDVSPAER